MLDIRNYFEDIRHIINCNSPAQMKMFIFRYKDADPHLLALLDLDRDSMKLYLHHLKQDILPTIEKYLHNKWDDDTLH